MAGSDRLQSILIGASELPPGERAAYLDAACRGDAALRAEVESLLRSHEGAGRFLASPTAEAPLPAPSMATETAAAMMTERAGMRIGPYKILQLIGEGGFGTVFMAEQERPVTRKVALKIIKLGMDTRQVVARFEQERQALAMMDHPSIARVLDAGATETGRPYFVMELVKGDPIVEYCDRNNLSIQDRLELFAQVCNAVQHAHTKGIIHRDIKPSNILVTTQDGKPHAKVIDFGIAKATASKLTEKTLFTEHKALIGTPEYMSPEQAEGSLDIDTRTDVYSLGVLLYELLTGSTPFSGRDLRSAAYAEVQRIIREVEPPKPSTRISQNTETNASVALRRHTEPKRLGSMVRGELDWIVMMALEKDRQRRYETANGLAMDIRRYLEGEAVLAAPPGRAYRFKKFIRRNRVMVTSGVAVAASLLIGLIAFAWQATEANRQRDIAVQAQKDEAQQRRKAEAASAEARAQQLRAESQEVEARKQAAIAEAVAKFQTDMLAAADPQRLLGDQVTVLQAMEAAVRELDAGSLNDQPLVEAGVRNTIGKTLFGLARYEDAETNLRKSLALRRMALPAGHTDIGVSLNNLAELLWSQNRTAEAEPIQREAVRIFREAFPGGHLHVALSLNNLAVPLMQQNRLAEAEPLFREAVEIVRAVAPEGSLDIANAMHSLAHLLQAQRKFGEAEQQFRESLRLSRAGLPAGHPSIAVALHNLAMILKVQNKLAEAEPLYREALEIHRAALPAGHPSIGQSLNNLARLLQDQQRFAEAEPLFRESLEIYRAALPAGHPRIALGLNNLAVLLISQNKHAEAEPLFREALEIYRAARPSGHPDIALGLGNLASILLKRSRAAEAEPLIREAMAVREQAEPDSWLTFYTRLMLGTSLLDQGKYSQAEPHLVGGYEGMKQRESTIPGPAGVRIREAIERLVRLYEEWDKAEPGKGYDAKAAAWKESLDRASVKEEQP